MESFKQFCEEALVDTSSQIDEVLNTQQRLARKQSFRRNKAKISMGRKRAERRTASQAVLKRRAMRMARKLMLKRLLKNKEKSDLPYSQRAQYEKIIDKRKAGIARLAAKLIPRLRKLDLQRHSGNKKPTANTAPLPQA